MKTKLIVNPASGHETALGHLPAINARLREAGDVDIVLTIGEGDAVEAGRRAAMEGCDRVFVAGGDGTLNEVLNGLAQVNGALSAITLAVVPLGTGNDFATAIGVPDSPEDAVDALLGGTVASVDVGRVNDRSFLNISAGGFIADVSDAVNPQLKTVLGKLAYLVGGAQVLLDFEPVGARVASAGTVTKASLLAFAVCNSRLIGGGRLIAPHAIVDDGWLDVCLIHAMPALDFVALLRRVSSGDHVDDDRVTYFRTQALELVFDRVIRINTDGQVLEAHQCRYDVLARAARVLMPRAAGTTPESSGVVVHR
jgi:diacylglycerol kinase (ATP)